MVGRPSVYDTLFPRVTNSMCAGVRPRAPSHMVLPLPLGGQVLRGAGDGLHHLDGRHDQRGHRLLLPSLGYVGNIIQEKTL